MLVLAFSALTPPAQATSARPHQRETQSHFDLASFAIASLISRSLRFYLVAALLWAFGDKVRDFIERRLMLVTSAFVGVLVGGFLVLRYL